MSTAAAAEVPAVMKNTALGPSSATNVPASAGPRISPTAVSVSRTPTRRSSETPLRRTTDATGTSRAVAPGTSPNAPMMPSTTNHQSSSPHSTSTTGRAAMAPAEIRSDATERLRRFHRSSTKPATSPISTAGTAVDAAMTPMLSGLPVTCRTMSGSAIAAMPLPSSERKWEPR